MARTMTVALGDELWEYIESLIESGDYRTQSEVIRESLRLLREKQAESRLQVSCGIYWQKAWAAVNLCRGKKSGSEKSESWREGFRWKPLNSHLKPVRIWRISSITGTTISVKSRLINILIRYPTFFRLWVIIISVLPVLNWGNTHSHYPLNGIWFIFCKLILKLLLFVY